MNTAPIQLSQISFRRVSVELDASRFPDDGTPPAGLSLDFENVTIATHVSFSPLTDATKPGTSYLLILRVVIDNQPTDDKQVRFSPYLVDIEAGAEVRTLPGAEALGNIEDLVVVNGTSLLWSAVREQLCNLTARMPAGLVVLPTVTFRDLRKVQQHNSEVAEPKARKGIARKATKSGATKT